MDKTAVAIAFIIVAGIASVAGCITAYNIRSATLYAGLLKEAADPLAIKCAWNNDGQLCLIVAAKK